MEKKIVVNDKNVKDVVRDEIKRLGNKADLNYIDVSQVTDMNDLFRWSNFNGDISKWDVSNVEDMGYMFYESQFNQDISNWDVGNVENMYGMFEDSPFDKNIDMWNYNFKLVEAKPYNFELSTTGSYTLIEKYIKALENKNFDLAEKIKFKMKGIRFNYRYKDIEESKHLVTLDSKLLKEFKEYLWKRK